MNPAWNFAASSFREAARAARANLVPGLILQCALAIFFVLYATNAAARDALEKIAAWKANFGFGFAFVGYAFASAFLPEVLRVAVFQKFRVRWPNMRMLLYSAPFWGAFGMLVDALYRGQTLLFGAGNDLRTVLAKLIFDQFLFSPFLGTPILVAYFAWVDGGRAGFSKVVAPREFVARVVRVQCAGWMVWIPGVALIYSMPELLQVPLAVAISAFWVLVLTVVRQD